ncbi:hypothetical protein MPLB_30011 [Mesorhizobium sp. ORS 3324]|nr:hypothetical protein MPLB_30011 [Mesorhizobium sp. ORS 3324]
MRCVEMRSVTGFVKSWPMTSATWVPPPGLVVSSPRASSAFSASRRIGRDTSNWRASSRSPGSRSPVRSTPSRIRASICCTTSSAVRECSILEKISLNGEVPGNGTDVAQIKWSVANWSNYLSNSPDPVACPAAPSHPCLPKICCLRALPIAARGRGCTQGRNQGASRVGRDVQPRISAARPGQRDGLPGA